MATRTPARHGGARWRVRGAADWAPCRPGRQGDRHRRNCGAIAAVRRVERLVEYRADATGGQTAPNAQSSEAVAAPARPHDRKRAVRPRWRALLLAELPPQPMDRWTAWRRPRRAGTGQSPGAWLSRRRIDYLLVSAFQGLAQSHRRGLMMFAQANSEHCRHKIFNARSPSTAWRRTQSLFRHDPPHPPVRPQHTGGGLATTPR